MESGRRVLKENNGEKKRKDRRERGVRFEIGEEMAAELEKVKLALGRKSVSSVISWLVESSQPEIKELRRHHYAVHGEATCEPIKRIRKPSRKKKSDAQGGSVSGRVAGAEGGSSNPVGLQVPPTGTAAASASMSQEFSLDLHGNGGDLSSAIRDGLSLNNP